MSTDAPDRPQGEVLWDVADGRLGFERSTRLPIDAHLAAVGLEEATDDGNRRRLAGAVGAQQPVTPVVIDREGHIIERGVFAELLSKAPAGKHGWTLTWMPATAPARVPRAGRSGW
jgi:hypothetical protein